MDWCKHLDQSSDSLIECRDNGDVDSSSTWFFDVTCIIWLYMKLSATPWYVAKSVVVAVTSVVFVLVAVMF